MNLNNINHNINVIEEEDDEDMQSSDKSYIEQKQNENKFNTSTGNITKVGPTAHETQARATPDYN